MLEKEKIEQIKPADDKRLKKNESVKAEIFKDQARRYRFYYDSKPSEKHPELLSEEDIGEAKEYIFEWEEVPSEVKNEDRKTPEIIEEIEQRKKWISEFGKKIGLPDLKNRLTKTSNIYLLSEKTFKECAPDPFSAGQIDLNEIVIKKRRLDLNYLDIQHELVHSGCVSSIYFEKKPDGSGKYQFDNIRSGYGSLKESGKLHFFNESMVDATTLQMYFENSNNFLNDADCGCINEIILLSELIKDITEKIKEKAREISSENSEEKMKEFIKIIPQYINGQQREKTKEEFENVAKNLTKEETLAHLQRGMFEGERKYLKIINNIYGKEAFNALVDMTHDKKNIIEIAKLFGLDEVENKIASKENGREIEVNIGNCLCALTRDEKTKRYSIKNVKRNEAVKNR